MRKIINLVIFTIFLFTNTAYPANLRAPVGQIRPERTDEAVNLIQGKDSSDSDSLEAYHNGLPAFDKAYLKGLQGKFKTKETRPLIIGDNFEPSARLKEPGQREKLLGAKEYSDLVRDLANREAAKNVILTCNPMNGGLGSSVAREEYLKRIWEEIGRSGTPLLGAKATDLYFDVTLEGFNEQGEEIEAHEKISISELKYLQALTTASHYGELIIKELVNEESAYFIKAFLDTIFILDRIDGRIHQDQKRTYRQVIEETPGLKVSEDFIYQASLPTIDLQTGLLTVERKAPGGHGQLGTMALYDAQTIPLPDGKVLIRSIYNGDGPNNFPDANIVGWMARNKIPIVMISTTKAEIDKKGGQIGVEFLKDSGKTRTQMLERAQAIANNQEEWFYRIGLPGNVGDEGEPDTQYFNTNTVLINYSVLAPFLVKLRDIIPEEFVEIITPDLIKNTKEQGGKQFTQLEGALGSALLNLNGFIQTTDNEKVKALLKEHKIDRLLYIVNIDRQQRDSFFTPVKFAYDYWFYAYSDHFEVDTSKWQLKNSNPGHLPGFEEMDDYYKDAQNCINAFGKASTIGLNSLSIKGKVHLRDAVLMGTVKIISQYPKMVELNSKKARKRLRQAPQGNIRLDNTVVIINAEGEVSYLLDYFIHRGVGTDIANQIVQKVLAGELNFTLFQEGVGDLLKLSKVFKRIEFRSEASIITELFKWHEEGGKFSEEKFDIIQIQDGREVEVGVLDSLLAHKFSFRHRTTNAFIVLPDGKVVLQRRAHHKRAEPLRMSIYGGHVKAGSNYSKTIREELKEELELPEGRELEGSLVLIRDEGAFEWYKNGNRETRSLYFYFASPEEAKYILKSSEDLERQKSDRTREQFEKMLEDENKKNSGHAEVWGIYLADISELISQEALTVKDVFKNSAEEEVVDFTSDLLGPMAKDAGLMTEVSSITQAITQVRGEIESGIEDAKDGDELTIKLPDDLTHEKEVLYILAFASQIARNAQKVLEILEPLQYNRDIKVRVYSREIEAGDDIFETIKDLWKKQLNVTRITEGLKEDRFLRILEDGKTVDYAVYDAEGRVEVYQGGLTEDALGKAVIIGLQNTMRAKRPARAGAGRRATGDEPNMRHLVPENVKKNTPLELWVTWRGPSNNTWWFMFNPFAIWPNNPGNSASDQYHHLTVSRGDGFVHQRDIINAENLGDLFNLFTQLNDSPDLVDERKFRLVINGWYYSEEESAPKAGASQVQTHAQVIRFIFPIEREPRIHQKTIGDVEIFTLANLDWGTGIVLEAKKEKLREIGVVTQRIVRGITNKGHSFNVIISPSGEKITVFIADRIKGTPEPHFTNEWAFAEFGRVPIVDAPELFYELTEEQKADFKKTSNKTRWVREQKQGGYLKDMNPEFEQNVISALKEITAPQDQIEALINSIKDDFDKIPSKRLQIDHHI